MRNEERQKKTQLNRESYHSKHVTNRHTILRRSVNADFIFKGRAALFFISSTSLLRVWVDGNK